MRLQAESLREDLGADQTNPVLERLLKDTLRLQLRAVVVVTPPSEDGSSTPIGDRIAATVEVINNANGRTAFALAALPAIQQLQSPPVGD